MKTTKRILALILGLFTLVSLTAVGVTSGIMNNKSPETTTVPTAGNISGDDVLYIQFKAYDYDDYMATKKLAYWEADKAAYTNMQMMAGLAGVNPEDAWKGAATGAYAAMLNMKAAGDNSKTPYEFYGNKTYAELDAGISSGTIKTSPTAIDKIIPGTKIVIVPEIRMDLACMNFSLDIDVSGISAYTTKSEYINAGYLVGQYFNPDAFTNTKLGDMSAFPSGIVRMAIGGAGVANTNINDCQDFSQWTGAGQIVLEVKNGISGTQTITANMNANTVSGPYNVPGGGYHAQNKPDKFNVKPLVLTVDGPSDSTDIKVSVAGHAVESKDITTQTLDGQSVEIFTGNEQQLASTSALVSITSNDSAQILQVVDCTPSQGQSLEDAFKAARAKLDSSSDNTSINYSPLALGNPGETKYIAVKVQSQDETNTAYKIIAVPREADNYHKLDKLQVTPSGGSTVTADWDKPFNGNTTSYEIAVADDTTQITLKPEIINTSYSNPKIEIDGTTVASGATYPLSVNLKNNSTKQITIKVTAQNGTDISNYTIKFIGKSTDTSLAQAPTVTSKSLTKSTTLQTSPVDTYKMNVSDMFPYWDNNKATYATFTINARANAAKGTVTVDGQPVDKDSNSKAINFANNIEVNGQTISIRVTAPAGNYKDYNVIVYRKNPSSAKEINTATSYLLDQDAVSLAGAWSSDTYTATDKVAYLPISNNEAGVQIYAELAPGIDSGLVTATINGDPYDLGTNSTTYKFGTNNTITLKLKLTAQDNSTKEYTFIAKREDPSTNRTITFKLIGATSQNEWSIDPNSNTANKYYLYTIDGGADSSGTIEITPQKPDNVKVYYSQSLNGAKTQLTKSSGNIYTKSGLFVSSTYGAPNLYYFFITDEAGTTDTYTIAIQNVDTRSKENKLIDAVFDGLGDYYTYNENNTGPYIINVPYSVKEVNYKLEVSTNAKLYNGGTGFLTTLQSKFSLTAGQTVTKKVQVVADNGDISTKIYEFQFTRQTASTENSLLQLTLGSYYTNTWAEGEAPTTIDVLIPRSTFQGATSISGITFQTSPKSVIKSISTNVSNGVLSISAGQVKTFTLSVSSEKQVTDGGSKTYTVNVYVASEDFALLDMALQDGSDNDIVDKTSNSPLTFNPATSKYTLTIPYTGPASGKVLLDLSDSNAYLSYNGGVWQHYDPLNPFTQNIALSQTSNKTTTYTIKVKSEYAYLKSGVNQEATYTIEVTREKASDVKTLDNLSFSIDGVAYLNESSPVPNANKVENLAESLSSKVASVTFKLTNPNCQVTVPNATNLSINTSDGTGSFNYQLSNLSSPQEINIVVTPEDGTQPNTYKITVSKQPIILDDTNGIFNIEVYKDNDSTTNLLGTYNVATTQYSITVPGSVGNVKVQVSKDSTKSTVQIDTVPGDSKTVQLKPAGQTTTIIVQCISESGKAGTAYEINIKREQIDTDNTLKSLTANNDSIMDYINKTYYIPYDPAISSYEVNIATQTNSSKATVSTDPFDPAGNLSAPLTSIAKTQFYLAPGDSQDLTVHVYSEGSQNPKDYKVKIVYESDNSLTNLSAITDNDGKELITSFSASQDIYDNITVDYAQDTVTIAATAKTPALQSQIVGEGQFALKEGLNTFEVKIPSESGSYNVYKIEITRANGNDNNYIDEFTTELGDVYPNFRNNYNGFIYRVDANINQFNPGIKLEDDKATWDFDESVAARKITDGKNVFHITVKSEKGTPRQYTFTVIRASADCDITDIEVNDINDARLYDVVDPTKFVDYDPTTMTYTLTVNYSTAKVIFDVTASSTANIYINNSPVTASYNLAQGTNTFTIYAESAYASYIGRGKDGYTAACSDQYTVTIIRNAASSDARLKELKIVRDGVELPMTPAFDWTDTTNTNYLIENVGAVGTVMITRTPNHSGTQIISGPDNGAYTVNVSTGSAAHIITFITEAEDGSRLTYTVTISSDKMDLDKDVDVSYYEITGSQNNKSYFGQKDFDPEITSYNLTIPYGDQAITIAGKPANPNSPMTFKGTGNIPITSNMYGQTISYTVQALPKDPDAAAGKEYTFNITFEAPNGDASLKNLEVNNVQVPNFDPDTTVYDLGTVPFGTTSIDFKPELNDPNTQIFVDSQIKNGQNNEYSLKVGDNIIDIVVRAQDGTEKRYQIKVKRDFEEAKVTKLSVDGEKLLDVNDSPVEFDESIYEYHVIVPFTTVSANITLEVPTNGYVTTCTNSSPIYTGTTRKFENLILEVGKNPFTVTATSEDGKEVTYTVTITRRPESSQDASIQSAVLKFLDKDKIDLDLVNDPNYGADYDFSSQYTPEKHVYQYTVPNKVRNLELNVIPTVTPNKQEGIVGATVSYYNTDNLKVGVNNVLIVVQAEDGIHSNAIVLEITREAMEYEINKELNDYTITVSDTGKNTYVIELGDEPASVIEDYSKYIVFDAADKLEVTVLSDTTDPACHEVLVMVSDGDQVEIVTFKLNTTSGTGDNETGGNLTMPEFVKEGLPWILLAIAIVLLVAILICVNRDKYGSINKKRKNEND